VNEEGSEYHSAGSNSEGRVNLTPKQEDLGSGDDCSDHLEGEQYDPDDAEAYQFSSGDDSEPVYSRATRIIATSALNKIESRVAKASKPTPPKTPIVESNRAQYKIVKGVQPQRVNRLQRCIEVTIPINRLPARVLLDGGSNTNMISPEFANVMKVPTIELQEQMMLQLAVMGSCSKINYGTWVPVEFGPVNATTYFNIANIDGVLNNTYHVRYSDRAQPYGPTDRLVPLTVHTITWPNDATGSLYRFFQQPLLNAPVPHAQHRVSIHS